MPDLGMNYFEYQDFARVDRSKNITITTDFELQTGSDIEQLRYGIKPYDYASFEKDSYITSNPKVLAPKNAKLGFLTKNVSDGNGYFTDNPEQYMPSITIDLHGGGYTFPGITIGFIGKVNFVEIDAIASDGKVYQGGNSHAGYWQGLTYFPFYYEIPQNIVKVILKFRNTKLPHQFLGIYRIDLGRTVIFDASKLIEANVITHYNTDGTSIEYDIAEMTLFNGEDDTKYLFQKKQPILYKNANGNTLHKFYIDNGEETNDYTISLTAYDSISLLEDEYLGGIYGFEINYANVAPPITYRALVDDILAGTGVEYVIDENIKDTLITGYIPICTRRKALSLLCKGTNTRAFKHGGKIYLRPIDSADSITLTESNIAENPNIQTTPKIGRFTVIEHNYQKDTETVDLYNWYLRQGDNTEQMIKFNIPVWKVLAYEVTGTDANGNDVVSDTPTNNVIFYHAPIGGGAEQGDANVCNHCIIKSVNTSNKVVIRGWKIIDDANDDVYYERTDLDSNAEYEDIVVDDITVTTADGIGEVAKTLFAIENQRQTEEFTVVDSNIPTVGSNISTPMVVSPVAITAYNKNGTITNIQHNVKISEVEDNLSGTYRVVAK